MNGGRIFAIVWLMGALSIPGWPQIRRIVYPLTPPQGGNYNPYLGQQQHNATTYPTPTPWRVNGSPVPATASPGSYLVSGPGGSPGWTATPSPAATGYNGPTPYPTPTSFAVNGSPVPATASPFSYLQAGAGGTATWAATPVPAYSQLSAGNGTYGNSSPYSANLPLSNEVFALGGKITHLSVQNVSGGACTTAPTFNVYVIHGGVETDGTALTGSTTQESITAGPTSRSESVSFVAGDIVGTKIDTTSAPASCNSVIYDVDALVCVGPTC